MGNDDAAVIEKCGATSSGCTLHGDRSVSIQRHSAPSNGHSRRTQNRYPALVTPWLYVIVSIATRSPGRQRSECSDSSCSGRAARKVDRQLSAAVGDLEPISKIGAA